MLPVLCRYLWWFMYSCLNNHHILNPTSEQVYQQSSTSDVNSETFDMLHRGWIGSAGAAYTLEATETVRILTPEFGQSPLFLPTLHRAYSMHLYVTILNSLVSKVVPLLSPKVWRLENYHHFVGQRSMVKSTLATYQSLLAFSYTYQICLHFHIFDIKIDINHLTKVIQIILTVKKARVSSNYPMI